MLDKQKDLNSLRNNVTEIQEANFVCRLIGMIVYDNLKIAIQILDRISIEEKSFFFGWKISCYTLSFGRAVQNFQLSKY